MKKSELKAIIKECINESRHDNEVEGEIVDLLDSHGISAFFEDDILWVKKHGDIEKAADAIKREIDAGDIDWMPKIKVATHRQSKLREASSKHHPNGYWKDPKWIKAIEDCLRADDNWELDDNGVIMVGGPRSNFRKVKSALMKSDIEPMPEVHPYDHY